MPLLIAFDNIQQQLQFGLDEQSKLHLAQVNAMYEAQLQTETSDCNLTELNQWQIVLTEILQAYQHNIAPTETGYVADVDVETEVEIEEVDDAQLLINLIEQRQALQQLLSELYLVTPSSSDIFDPLEQLQSQALIQWQQLNNKIAMLQAKQAATAQAQANEAPQVPTEPTTAETVNMFENVRSWFSV